MRHSFEGDILSWSKSVLRKFDYSIPEKDVQDPLACLSLVFAIERQLVSPVPREVKIARGFKCPSHLLCGYAQLIHEIEHGLDLTPRLSRKIKDKKIFIDKMLADFGVRHFHLGVDIIKSGHKKGMVVGGEEVIFAWVDAYCFYVIGIYDHNSWTKESVLETIYENWPELLGKYELRGAVGLSRYVSESDRERLRKANINTPVQIKNKIYFSPGSGLATDGSCARDVEKALVVLRAADSLVNWLLENKDFLRHRYDIDCTHEYFYLDVERFIFFREFIVYLHGKRIFIKIPSDAEQASLINPELAGFFTCDLFDK